MTTAPDVLARCEELGRITSSPGCLQRLHLTDEHAAANRLAAGWMREAGLEARQDAAGNQWGRREGPAPGLPALVVGSHLDTVPDAGRYDGVLGVVMAVAVAERLRRAELPFALEVVAFSDEEGARFGTALLGSRAVAGTWEDTWWDLRDEDGTTLRRAFDGFGLDPRRVGEAARVPQDLVGYLEAHIEQGPLLEAADRSLGCVTAIAGARRFRLSVLGEARHAGGTPWSRRRDALVGASEAVVAVERIARASGGIATVGRLEVHPGAVNVVPGRVDLTLDLRAATDAERDGLWEELRAEVEALCERRGLGLEVLETHRAPAAACAPWLQEAVVEGVRATDDRGAAEPLRLWSPAGHDAMALAATTDVGMLFLRCADGISHSPDEAVREVDVARGLDALEAAVLHVAASVRARVRA